MGVEAVVDAFFEGAVGAQDVVVAEVEAAFSSLVFEDLGEGLVFVFGVVVKSYGIRPFALFEGYHEGVAPFFFVLGISPWVGLGGSWNQAWGMRRAA